MQTHKRLIARILSLVLTSSMVLTTLPLNVLASDESSEITVTPFVTENNENNEEGSTELGMLMSSEPLNATNTATGYDLNDANVTIGTHAEGECGEKNPHVINGTTTNNTISVTGGKHWITLSNVNIDVSKKEVINNSDESTIQGKAAFAITNAEVHLILTSKNTLKSGYGRAGLEVPEGATLHIVGDGTLNVTGGPSGAGIGGGSKTAGGTINISGGEVIATGGAMENDMAGGGAGIGGGYNGAGGTISISGGDVMATGGSHNNGGGAGIGSGFFWGLNTSVNGGTIAISGGKVTATGGMQGAGIGGGSGSDGGTITISGSDTSVTATGGSSISNGGAGIGGGYNGVGGTITISSGEVEAIGGKFAAGTGGGSGKTGGTITINGGKVTSTGGMSGAGIGGGFTGAGGDITITNGIITANGIDGGAGIGGGWGKSAGTITISGNTTKVIATGTGTPGGAGVGDGFIINKENGSASVSISAGANVTAVSIGDSSAILGEIKDTNTHILQLDFLNEVEANSNIKVLTASEEKASYTSTSKFQSIAFTVPTDKYKATLGSNPLVHYNDSSSSEEFEIKAAGLTKFNKVKVKEGGSTAPVDPTPDPTPNPTPTPPSTGGSSSNTSNNIGAEGTESGSSVKVTTTRTPDEVKDIIEDKYIIDTIEIKKAEEPVKIKIKVDKKKTKDIFVVQTNPETKKVELVAKSEVDNKGYAEFMSDSKEKLTIVTQLYVGFIDTVATVVKPSVTYYIDETQTFKKGWFKLEDKDWYFADYKNEEIQKNRWVADGEDSNKLAKWYYLGEDGVMFEGKWIANNADGTKWYYVDQNGLFLRDTVIDGYVINSEGYWSK